MDLTTTSRNSPQADLLVGGCRLSIKSETGSGTDEELITITKLCTTEREPWEAPVLVDRVLAHLSRYDSILMLRAIWDNRFLRYQLLKIPIPLLRMIASADIRPVGRRQGRGSLGGDIVNQEGEVLFTVHFDGSDGKCQVRRLPVARTRVLLVWDYRVP